MTPGANSHLPFPRTHRTTRLALAAMGLLLAACTQAQKPQTQEYMFWPPAPEAPHIQYLTTIASSGDVVGKQAEMDQFLYGKDRSGDLPFQRPYGIRMINGQIFICDASAGNVTVLDFRKKEVRILGVGAQTMLSKPIDIAVASDGIKYIADTGHGAVMVYDGSDHYAGKVAVKDMRPVSVGVHDNELYVSDITASRVRVFDRFNGKELHTIGEPGGGTDGKIGGAMGLAIDAQGNIFVNDVIGCRVQKFSPEGKFLSAIGGLGRNPGNFVRPKLMTVDSAGILYVVDNAFQNVQMFNEKGKMLMFFGGPGRHDGAMSMPTGVTTCDTDLDIFARFVHPAFEAQRIVLVTNNLGPNKINVYALGELKPGKTPADISQNRSAFIGSFDTNPTITIGPEAGTLPDEATTAPATQPETQPSTQPTTQPAAPASEPTTSPATTTPTKEVPF